ncbi:MAG: hypothetical protein LCH67_14430 [Bacteroidetes bacterium]|nr:hypothetical protein [Bacteroidota bacterium]
MKKTQKGILVFLVLLIFACSQERLFPVSTESEDLSKVNFVDAKNTLVDLGPKSEKLTIKNESQIPIITKNGNRIYLYQYHLATLDGKSVSYPYDVEIIELGSLKDMILFDKPTVSYGKILSTAGSFYLNATKDQNQLKISNLSYPSIQYRSNFGLDRDMNLFYGELNKENQFNWFPTKEIDTGGGPIQSREGLSISDDFYYIFPSTLGWINVDKFVNVATEKTTMVFKSLVPDLEKIALFVVLPEINSVMHVYSGKSFEIPVGMMANIMAVAKDTEGQYFSYIEKVKVKKGLTVEIKLSKTTEAELINALKVYE